MKSINLILTSLSFSILLFLWSCSTNSNTTASRETTPNAKPSVLDTEATSKKEARKEKENRSDVKADKSDSEENHSHESRGGQVVETGEYHLELVKEKEERGYHLHLYLQKGHTHQPVANAIVKARIQSPDGKEQQLKLKYEEKEEAYTGVLNNAEVGTYQVKIIADINGDKINGRFQFE